MLRRFEAVPHQCADVATTRGRLVEACAIRVQSTEDGSIFVEETVLLGSSHFLANSTKHSGKVEDCRSSNDE